MQNFRRLSVVEILVALNFKIPGTLEVASVIVHSHCDHARVGLFNLIYR